MEITTKVALGLALLLCLTQTLSADTLANCDCNADSSTIAPQIEDMRWLTHGYVPAQTREVHPLICHLDCWD